MKRKLYTVLVITLAFAIKSYGQNDSVRTRNDKPGTPQSLRTSDQSPQSHVEIKNTNTIPGQTISPATTGNNGTSSTIVTDPNTAGKPVPTSPITLVNKPRDHVDTSVKNSAIQNGVSNVTNPIRKQ